MRYVWIVAFIWVFLASLPVQAVGSSLELEEKIAYQQGLFGGLYARCGAPDEQQAVIGGSLATWRTETFRGYQGNSNERMRLGNAFDKAAAGVVGDPSACKDWIKKAAATWRDIVQLVQYGEPVSLKP